MTITKKSKATNIGKEERGWKIGPFTLLAGMEISAAMEISVQVAQKTNKQKELLYDLAILFLGI